MKSLTLLFLQSLFLATTCLADQKESPSEPVESEQAPPEYLPGEEVTTKSGQKMKVWSTRGAVGASKAAEPFDKEYNPEIGVIVDGRKPNHPPKRHD